MRSGDQLDFYWRDSGPSFNWNGPYNIETGAWHHTLNRQPAQY